MTFRLANYCHEYESMLEFSIPKIDKFICRNDLLPDMMKTLMMKMESKDSGWIYIRDWRRMDNQVCVIFLE